MGYFLEENMKNDCSKCKWCLRYKPSGSPRCHCNCPSVLDYCNDHHNPDPKIRGYAAWDDEKEEGEYGCHFEPKECEESNCEQCSTSCKNNQGREFCFKCNTKTIKVSTGMFTVYDICPNCKI